MNLNYKKMLCRVNEKLNETISFYIKGFKRPLRIVQVKKSFNEFGKLKYFWINNIRSECLITFCNSEQGEKCRKRLDKSYFPFERERILSGFLKFNKIDEKEVKFAIKNLESQTRDTNGILQNMSEINEKNNQKYRKIELIKMKQNKTKNRLNSLAEQRILTYFQKTKAKPMIYFKLSADNEIEYLKNSLESNNLKKSNQDRFNFLI